MAPPDDRARERATWFARLFESMPFNRLAGIRVLDIGEDRARVSLPFRRELVRTEGVVHGGAISALVDNAAALAVWSTYPANPKAGVPRGASVDMNLSFLAAVRGEDLVAEARVIKRGQTLVFAEVEVTTPAGKRVAKGTVTYLVKQ